MVSWSIDINDKCNLRCTYCFAKGKGSNEMTKTTFTKILEYINRTAKGRSQTIWFFGMEPLISWHKLRYFILRIRAIHPKWKVGLTTNATLLTPDKAIFFKRNNISVLVSCDGIQKAHDRHRVYPTGDGTWQRVIESIGILQKYKVQFSVALSVVPENVPELFDSVLMLYGLGVPAVALNKVVVNQKARYNVQLLQAQYYNIAEWYLDHFKEFKVEFLQSSLNAFKNNPRGLKGRNTCGACQGSIAFDWNGNIMICHSVSNQPEFVVGSVYNPKRQEIDREKFFKFQRADVKKCFNCPIHPCRACFRESWYLYGNLTGIDPERCIFESAKYQAAKGIYDRWRDKNDK